MGVRENELAAEYGRLVDDRFLGNWDAAKALRLDEISAALDEADAPRIAAMREDFAAIEGKVNRILGKMSEDAPVPPQTDTARTR
jgi:hypothetical protein